MFDIGMPEMVVIGVVALIVVGPKDLPMMFRKVGQFVGKARGMARDFQRAMDSAADEAGVGEATAAMKQATSMKNLGLDDIKTSMSDYQSSFEPKKVNAAAEHAARVKAAEDANAAGAHWPPEGVPVVSDSEVVPDDAAAVTEAASKKTAANKPPKKPAAKKAAAKKPAAKKAAAKKSATAKKTPVRKTTKKSETKA